MATEELQQPDQFEILAMIHGNRDGIKRLVFLQFILILLLILGLIYVSQKPPLVIRIDKIGNTDAVLDYKKESSQPSVEDVQYFTKKFLDDYIALKSNLVVRQFETTLNMMTEELSKQHLKAMKEQNTVGIIQAAGIRNDLSIQDIHSENVGDEIYTKIRAELHTRPLEDLGAVPKTKPILATLVLQIIPRSVEHPYGLLTKGVQIQVDRNGSPVEQNLGEVLDEAQ